jgi:hypothetical protein
MLSDWALMKEQDGGLILNYYGPSTLTAKLKPGLSVTRTQETEYPVDGKIVISVKPSRSAAFSLKLRIPHWSAKTRVTLNGEAISSVKAGNYLTIDRKWKSGDRIHVTLDMSLHLWRGEQECKGLASVYRGPILLAYDHRYNLDDAGKGKLQIRDIEKWDAATCMMKIPPVNAQSLKTKRVQWSHWLPPLLLMEFKTAEGKTVRLCDFGSAGEAGTPYCSWLPVKNCHKAAAFSRESPLRSTRV